MSKIAIAAILIPILLAACAVAQSSKDLTPARAVTDARYMRDRLNDPDSLRITSFVYYHDGGGEPTDYALCSVFRAKNEHGGLVIQTYVLNSHEYGRNPTPGTFNSDLLWPILCKGAVVLDATDAVKAALKADREKD